MIRKEGQMPSNIIRSEEVGKAMMAYGQVLKNCGVSDQDINRHVMKLNGSPKKTLRGLVDLVEKLQPILPL